MELTLCQIKYQFKQPELKVNKIFNYNKWSVIKSDNGHQ